MGLIGVVYGATVMANALGFLAVFFAAVALRQTEQKLAQTSAAVAAPNPHDPPADVSMVMKVR
ncbi:MAG: hypothetical protein U5M53_14090 [Rhodoferax sp.]|nr:hypothetical protein [Rhodoferax sp.]